MKPGAIIGTVLAIAIVAVLGFMAFQTNSDSQIESQSDEPISVAESGLSQVKQIISEKEDQGVDVSGLEEDIRQIEFLIEEAKTKIKEGNETEARRIVEKVVIFNREIINNQGNITNVFKTKIEIKSNVALGNDTRLEISRLGESISNTNNFIDLRIRIREKNGMLRIEDKSLGTSNLNSDQMAMWNSIKDDVINNVQDSAMRDFETEVRIKRELEFEDRFNSSRELEFEFEREFERGLEVGAISPANAKRTRDQIIQIAETKVTGSLDRIELETENGRLVWNVRIISNGTRHDIRIDDESGTITRFRSKDDNSSGRGRNGGDDDNDDDNSLRGDGSLDDNGVDDGLRGDGTPED